MWDELVRALGLVLIIEGILPFLYPRRWRALVQQLASVDNRSLRMAGLVSMLAGTALLMLFG
ncbi:DUF2065 domain-containing protein [Microbulbifer hydrolyticus]|uniref:DUF2065 family protein n=1 Tax=Microbulbifer hydrolyticus TaxID=48074 RepID=A0A6P1T4K9_9GAMM|nr:DUF2065 domain-containing protein [Microbulbifer hydrolyticus]MBB5211421.1 hypothetical protein [Microbulbifer hydrolyticus]QHQ37824.1 DUF2065 family protein [Microbulbifer hydrolyticus]